MCLQLCDFICSSGCPRLRWIRSQIQTVKGWQQSEKCPCTGGRSSLQSTMYIMLISRHTLASHFSTCIKHLQTKTLILMLPCSSHHSRLWLLIVLLKILAQIFQTSFLSDAGGRLGKVGGFESVTSVKSVLFSSFCGTEYVKKGSFVHNERS